MKVIKPNTISAIDGSFTRASIANYWTVAKVMTSAAINEPRFNYDPDTSEFDGIVLEQSATNLLLNSTTLSTQSVTVSNTTVYTLSFYGTGTITLSDAFVSIQVGTGLFKHTVLTFTTITTSLTLTVTGTVSYAQLELGSKATSWITTTGTSATRSADVVTGSGLIYTTLTDTNSVYSSGTTYNSGDKVEYNNKIWESLQATNTNHQPDLSPTWWYDMGADNLHAAFDTAVSTVSTATTEMILVIKPGVIDSVSLINMDAATAKIAITDPVEGTVYRQVAGLSGSQVYDWYQYFFYDPLLKRTQVIFPGIPKYSNALTTIKLEGGIGDVIKLAQIILGQQFVLGGTQLGATTGIIEYSTKETDEFGNTKFVERAFSKRMSAQVFINNIDINRTQNLLYSIRATPCVWIGSDDPTYEEPLVVFGFFREFSMDISYPSFSMCSLEIEGLT